MTQAQLVYDPPSNRPGVGGRHCCPWLPAVLRLSVPGEYCHDAVHKKP